MLVGQIGTPAVTEYALKRTIQFFIDHVKLEDHKHYIKFNKKDEDPQLNRVWLFCIRSARKKELTTTKP